MKRNKQILKLIAIAASYLIVFASCVIILPQVNNLYPNSMILIISTIIFTGLGLIVLFKFAMTIAIITDILENMEPKKTRRKNEIRKL